MNALFTRMFTASGDLSSGRIGFYVGLVTLVCLITYDTIINKKLDPFLAGILASAGTVGYGITKNGDNLAFTAKGVKDAG